MSKKKKKWQSVTTYLYYPYVHTNGAESSRYPSRRQITYGSLTRSRKYALIDEKFRLQR